MSNYEQRLSNCAPHIGSLPFLEKFTPSQILPELVVFCTRFLEGIPEVAEMSLEFKKTPYNHW